MRLLWLVAACLPVLLAASCPPNGPDPPEPDPCTHPAPIADPIWTWRSADQVELTWPDMQEQGGVEVCGGNEDWVLRRRATLNLPEAKTPVGGSTFLGFVFGDRVEADFWFYDASEPALSMEDVSAQATLLYGRSPHYGDCGQDCYAAEVPFTILEPPSTRRIVVDTTCRIVGENAEGRLAARCHHRAVLQFKKDGGPPPGQCVEEGNLVDDPLNTCQPGQFGQKIKAATDSLGDLCGLPWQANLRALADRLRAQNPGLCVIAGKEANFIRRDDGRYDEYHTVASATGCWTNNGRGKYIGCHHDGTGPGDCGLPDPLGLPSFWTLKHHANWWDSTFKVKDFDYCIAAGFVGRGECPVRPEGHPERAACEARVVGAQAWWCDAAPITEPCSTASPPCLRNGNPAQAKCFTHVKTCTEDGTTCGEGDW